MQAASGSSSSSPASTRLVHEVLLPREVDSLKMRFAEALRAAQEAVAIEAFKARGKQQAKRDGGGRSKAGNHHHHHYHQPPPNGLDRKHFKALVLQLFRESRDAGHEPSSSDLDRAFDLAADEQAREGARTVDEEGFVRLYASVKKGEVSGLGGSSALLSSRGGSVVQSVFRGLLHLGGAGGQDGGGAGAYDAADGRRAAHYELIPDHLDGYRQALRANMDQEGRLSEKGLRLCLQRRPHVSWDCFALFFF